MISQQDYEILADADRYYILYELVQNNGLVTISDLAQQLAACSTVSEDSDRSIEHAKIRLVHNHLPRLEDHGLIEYDARSGDMRLTNTERAKALLETVEEFESVAVRPT
ncbi:DUF7344 domain-containing protein [Natrinema pallidum]|uniref:DUF7344 domain-containing protein n=1 Tax=Natrinema pallidum DSM 3751 TaxID=1227495 RepID=L9ZCK9_9EURY|nr:hypothetical protein [Natrinema pallidum]ELY83741.1 hypothetical protein C487_00225 [Natrinema pallidum DSM 3751]